MNYQAVFKRYEIKYLLTPQQKQRLLEVMAPHMAPDRYGRSIIRNIYFDTDSYRLIRRSMEKPAYKEKLRLRSYRQATADSTVFVELKKKYRGVVYKRRLPLTEAGALDWISGRTHCREDSQIAREVDYFLSFYGSLQPVVFLCYEREAYYSRDGSDFRVTFDEHILARREALSLEAPVWGNPLLSDDRVLMEVKCNGGMPLWLTAFLTREHIHKASFSKYGTAYETMIFPTITGGFSHV